MKMSQPGRDLPQRAFGVKALGDIRELIWVLYDIGERRWAQFESDVEEVGVGFLVVVSDDVGVIV